MQDFWIGCIVEIYNRKFEIIDADESTLQYFERHPDSFSMTNAREAVTQLKHALHRVRYRDEDGDSTCNTNTERDISTLDMLQQCMPGFTRHQLLNACRAILKQPHDQKNV